MSNIALIGIKSGMTAVFGENGEVIPLTLLKVDSNILMCAKSTKTDGYNAFVVAGGGEQKEHRVNKPQLSLFKKAGIAPRKVIKEFRVDFDLDNVDANFVDLELNDSIKGRTVDVVSVSKGKGFQGVMKRHGFGGMPASHGVSVTHRHGGSTGQREFPGKTFKNKKMAGRMGNTSVTVQNLKIFDVNKDLGIIAILGSIPGYNGATVFIKDSVKSRSTSANFMVNGVNLLSNKGNNSVEKVETN
jgi:large subunit ribosomal protein L3